MPKECLSPFFEKLLNDQVQDHHKVVENKHKKYQWLRLFTELIRAQAHSGDVLDSLFDDGDRLDSGGDSRWDEKRVVNSCSDGSLLLSNFVNVIGKAHVR